MEKPDLTVPPKGYERSKEYLEYLRDSAAELRERALAGATLQLFEEMEHRFQEIEGIAGRLIGTVSKQIEDHQTDMVHG